MYYHTNLTVADGLFDRRCRIDFTSKATSKAGILRALDKLTADELDGSLAYQMVWSLRDHAFGAYNALLIAAHDANRGDVHSAIFSWGHYSLFR